MFNTFLLLNSQGRTSPTFIPNLPWPLAVWVWVLTSWTSTEGTAAGPGCSGETDPAEPRPRPPSALMPGGRVTSRDAESMSLLRAVLISLSARWSEACTVVSVSGWGGVIPTENNNIFLSSGQKGKQQHYPMLEPWARRISDFLC